MNNKKLTTKTIEIIVLIIMALVSIIPIYWGIVTSLKKLNEISAYPPKFFGFEISLEHYERILSSGYFKCVFNSIIYAIIAIIFGLILGYIAAYGFERKKFKGKKFWFYIVVIGIPLSTGSSILLIPNYLLMMKLGLVNHFYTMPLLYMAYNLPLCTWLLISGIKALPYEIEEAARIDGCSQFYIMTRIIPPMIKPSIAAACLFIFIGAWNEYITTSVMVNGVELKNIQMAIYDYIGFFGQEWGPLCAAATFAIIPILLVFTFLGKQLVSGLTAGAVKG